MNNDGLPRKLYYRDTNDKFSSYLQIVTSSLAELSISSEKTLGLGRFCHRHQPIKRFHRLPTTTINPTCCSNLIDKPKSLNVQE